jgi:hypothetical protein
MRAMDDHQRRVWGRMIESIDAYRAGQFDLRKLVVDLQGLLGAVELHDDHLVREWWNHEAPIDMELELRTEAWAPEGSASDQALDRALSDFQTWARQVLDSTDGERT